MHLHDHDDTADQTERTHRADAEPDLNQLGRAAAANRPDVLGRAGLLGLQRSLGNSATSAMMEEERSPVHDVINSPGEPMPAELRTDMEGRFNRDLGGVRFHTDAAADASAKSVNAHAYTVGPHLVFQRDAYDPDSETGKKTIAHELTHYGQQQDGEVDGTPAPGGINLSDPSDRFERAASANAEHVMSLPAPTAQTLRSADATPTPHVQRAEADEDEEPADVQGSFVQREAAEESPEEEEATS
jgi:uncharacterized protein DUF4157